jgi:hypothetical protein
MTTNARRTAQADQATAAAREAATAINTLGGTTPLHPDAPARHWVNDTTGSTVRNLLEPGDRLKCEHLDPTRIGPLWFVGNYPNTIMCPVCALRAYTGEEHTTCDACTRPTPTGLEPFRAAVKRVAILATFCHDCRTPADPTTL